MGEKNYRSKYNEPIDYDKWQEAKAIEEPNISEVEYQGKIITVKKQYFGTVGSVFKVWVECTSDILKYYHYIKHYEGDLEAINDYLRIIEAIEEDTEIFDKTESSGQYSVIFDAKWNQHIVLDCSDYPEVDTCFNTRQEALVFYNNLIGG